MGKNVLDGRIGSVLGSTVKQWQGRKKSIVYTDVTLVYTH